MIFHVCFIFLLISFDFLLFPFISFHFCSMFDYFPFIFFNCPFISFHVFHFPLIFLSYPFILFHVPFFSFIFLFSLSCSFHVPSEFRVLPIPIMSLLKAEANSGQLKRLELSAKCAPMTELEQ